MKAEEQNPWPIIALILAGEAIFFLPFVIPRVFRPTFLELFDLTNYELGIAFSAYGIVAMISYFFGGFLADLFAPRSLLTFALSITAVSGLFLLMDIDYEAMKWLYAFWGMSTILLFWAAMIKATRIWGGKGDQNLAFGLLDGGRGLTAALVGTFAVSIFAWLLTDRATFDDKKSAFFIVLCIFITAILLIAILVFAVLPTKEDENSKRKEGLSWQKLLAVGRMQRIWLLAGMVVCAYVGYKSTDNSSLYAHDVLGFNDERSAMVGSLVLWMRPLVAFTLAFGLQKMSSTKGLVGAFGFMVLSGLIFGFNLLPLAYFPVFILSTILLCIGIYAARVLYFAVLEEARIPLAKTGTAVGLISVIGFTPDVFFGPLTGYLLDASPGLEGHQHLYQVYLLFGIIGFILALLFLYSSKAKTTQ